MVTRTIKTSNCNTNKTNEVRDKDRNDRFTKLNKQRGLQNKLCSTIYNLHNIVLGIRN